MASPARLQLLASLCVLLWRPAGTHAWDMDLELFDLVEEIPQTFYQFLSVPQDATATDIRKAYRRLSLTLHPDKNKDENAETQFRQLVAIYEVLKDEERRQRYDDILVNGLPDWRQPVFYYRRVRKMSNGELGFLLFLILTVAHYTVLWSIYLEKQLDELLSRKRREKKKKSNSRSVEELKTVGLDKTERASEKPHWQDILPLKMGIWLYVSLKSLPHLIQDVKQHYKDYKELKIKEKEEAEALAEQEALQKERRPKVKKPKAAFPIYEPSTGDDAFSPAYDQGTSIEEIEDQMDDWLEDRKLSKKKASEWTEEDLGQLTRSMVKFPGGTPGRWDKIAHELGRSVPEVMAKVKQVKECVTNTAGLVKLSALKSISQAVKSSLPDSIITQREEKSEEQTLGEPRRRRGGRPTTGSEEKLRSRRQRDFDPNVAAEDEDSGDERRSQRDRDRTDSEIWTQNQQRHLELALQQYPRGTAERWDKIAKVVPGKSKEECMVRYKLLAELVQKRRQTQS